jgi:hypothetical protein
MRKSRVLSVVAPVLMTAALTAQVREVPDSGCQGAPYPQAVGEPAIGQVFAVVVPTPSHPGGRPFLAFGGPIQPIFVGPAISCFRSCTLAIDPWFGFLGPRWWMLIPNDPALIGASFRLQSGATQPDPAGRPCVVLQGALDVRIMP